MDAVFDGRREDIDGADKLGGITVGNVEGHLHVAAFDQRAAGRIVGHLAHDDAPNFGQRPTDPVVIAIIDDLLALIPARHRVGTRSGGGRVQDTPWPKGQLPWRLPWQPRS